MLLSLLGLLSGKSSKCDSVVVLERCGSEGVFQDLHVPLCCLNILHGAIFLLLVDLITQVPVRARRVILFSTTILSMFLSLLQIKSVMANSSDLFFLSSF